MEACKCNRTPRTTKSATNVHFFLSRFLNCIPSLESHKMYSVLEVVQVLNSPQYVPTWTAYTNNRIQVHNER